MKNWTTGDIPSQAGKLAVVTGATGGLGYEKALALAGAGAEVILSGRNPDKGQDALRRIRATYPQATIRFEPLDLASLSSVYDFARRLKAEGRRVDILINNAGVMAPPRRQLTADGFERQFGTNYLGHFGLTAALLPVLHGARVVALSSMAHRQGQIDFDDLNGEQRYVAWKAYAQSKLAMLMFALELQRRSDAEGWGLLSLAAHPGWARTELVANGPGSRSLFGAVARWIMPFMGQSAAAGALPTLYAATAREALGGAYYGPDGWNEIKGYPSPSRIARQALDRHAAARLWEVSTRMIGAEWD